MSMDHKKHIGQRTGGGIRVVFEKRRACILQVRRQNLLAFDTRVVIEGVLDLLLHKTVAQQFQKRKYIHHLPPVFKKIDLVLASHTTLAGNWLTQQKPVLSFMTSGTAASSESETSSARQFPSCLNVLTMFQSKASAIGRSATKT